MDPDPTPIKLAFTGSPMVPHIGRQRHYTGGGNGRLVGLFYRRSERNKNR